MSGESRDLSVQERIERLSLRRQLHWTRITFAGIPEWRVRRESIFRLTLELADLYAEKRQEKARVRG
jgi:hypothetical protein